MIGPTGRKALYALKANATCADALGVEEIARRIAYKGKLSSLADALRRLRRGGLVSSSGPRGARAYRITRHGCTAMGSFPARGEIYE